MLEKLKENGMKMKVAVAPLMATAALMVVSPITVFAADSSAFDVSSTLATSFQGMADTMLKTIAASLPVVMSVMSAYICISFGIKFFRKFAK